MAKKVGIIAPFQNGDLLTAASVLRWREELWPGATVIWYTDDSHTALLKHLELEIRPFPHGWGIPAEEKEGLYKARIASDKEQGKLPWENWQEAMGEDGRLLQDKKHKFTLLADLDEGYFPLPWMFSPAQRHGLTYPECSQKIFGCEGKEWHPVIEFSDEERKEIMEFLVPLKGKRIFIETFAGSGQSSLNEQMVLGIVDKCKKQWGECSFIFASHKFLRNQEEFTPFLKEIGYFCSHLSVRLCGLLASYTDLMISVSSGITCAASAWDLTPPPVLQFTGSNVCGTRLLANGPFEMVTADDKSLEQAKEEFFLALNKMLIQYK